MKSVKILQVVSWSGTLTEASLLCVSSLWSASNLLVKVYAFGCGVWAGKSKFINLSDAEQVPSAIDLSQGSSAQLVSLAPILLSLVTSKPLDLNFRAKCAQTLAHLLRYIFSLAQRCFWTVSSRKCEKTSLTLPWRELFGLVDSQFKGRRKGIYEGKATQAYYASAIRSLVIAARRFFAVEVFQQILQEVEQQWCPHDNVIFRYLLIRTHCL